jgi:aminoglycoside phosphotransferase (APT) family kinase protein
MPAADVDVTTELVRRLLADQHQDLAGRPVEFLANGWDNAMFRLGDDLLVRLPRRQPAAQILLNEQRWLPVLAPEIQLPIPAPERTGRPAHGYPFSWSVVPYLPGEPAADARSLDLAGAADAVGGFLGSLHAPAPPDAPANPFRGVPLADRSGPFAVNLGLLSDQVDRDAVLRVWAAAIAAPLYPGPPRWLHGDLHPANILVSHGRVSGVIDFGDITAGDPATDLAVAWMLLPLEHHAAFRSAYRSARADQAGSPEDAARTALWTRARGWALNFAIVFLAHSTDNPQLLNVGRRTLSRVLTP